MVAPIATRRSTLYPGIEAEECPQWAQAFIGFYPPQAALGVPVARVSPGTRQAQADLFPAPVPGRRKRSQAVCKNYVKSWPIAFFNSCLPFALGMQHDLFAEVSGKEGPQDIAVLCFNRLYDFSKSLGMSYDQVEQWMMLLITLGFIRRFRHGRRFLYIIPLSDYAPQPTAEVVRDKLNTLIRKQFTEEVDPHGRSTYCDRNPGFTAYLLQVRSHFEKRYGLTPTEHLLLPSSAETTLAELLSEIQQVLPRLSQEELSHLTPVLMKRFLDKERQTGASEARRRSGRRWKSAMTIEASLSTRPSSFPPSNGPTQKDVEAREQIESGLSLQNLDSGIDAEESRFSTNTCQGIPKPIGFGSVVSATASEDCALPADVDSVANSLLTLRYLSLDKSLKDEDVNVSDKIRVQEEKRKKEEECQRLGEMLCQLFLDEKSRDWFTGIHRGGDLQLLRAAVINTMDIGLKVGYKVSAGACFTNTYNRWVRAHKSYPVACEAWQKWHGPAPVGIPPVIQDLVELHREDDYEQIAASMDFKLDLATGQPFPKGNQGDSAPLTGVQYLSQTDAQALESEIRKHASWYFSTIKAARQRPSAEALYAVKAQGDLFYLFTSREQWLAVHEKMLALPAECEQWYRDLQKGRPTPTEDEEACAQAALAYLTYRNRGLRSRDEQKVDWSQFQWDQLIALGTPLCFPRESVAVRQQEWGPELDQNSGGSEAIKLEIDVLDPTKRAMQALDEGAVREALDAGRLVRLDPSTVVLFDDYLVCFSHAQRILSEEEEQRSLAHWLRRIAEAEGIPFPMGAGETGVSLLPVDHGCSKQLEVPSPMDPRRPVEAIEAEALIDEQMMPLQEAYNGYKMLSGALDPFSYRTAVRPKRTVQRSGFILVVTSLLSGRSWTFGARSQIEEVLGSLTVSDGEGADGEEV